MSDGESLSEILSGSSATDPVRAPAEPARDVKPEAPKEAPAAAPSAAKAEEPKAEAPKAEAEAPKRERDESGKFKKAESPEKPQKVQQMVPLEALLAERAKRRDPDPAKPKTSVLENEDQAFKERVADEVEPLKATLFDISMEFARSRYDDFDEVAKSFAEMADRDQRLWDQMRSARNPALYLYQVGQQIRELAPFNGDLLAYRKHITADSSSKLDEANKRIAALEAEVEAAKKSQAQLESVPRSLNSAPSGSSPKAGETDADSIHQLVRFGNR